MTEEIPLPSWEAAAPWLWGQCSAFVVVALVAAGVIRALDPASRRRRFIALAWGLAMTVVPGLWIASTLIPHLLAGSALLQQGPTLLAALFGFGLHTSLAVLAVYVSDLAAGIEEDGAASPGPSFRPSGAPPSAPASGPTPGSVARAAPVAAVPPRRPPHLGPPEGAVVPAGGAPADIGRLLRALRQGAEPARLAAARSLGLSGAPPAQVGPALLDLVHDAAASPALRAAAVIALYGAFGEPLSAAQERTLLAEFPVGLDAERLLAFEAQLDAEG